MGHRVKPTESCRALLCCVGGSSKLKVFLLPGEGALSPCTGAGAHPPSPRTCSLQNPLSCTFDSSGFLPSSGSELLECRSGTSRFPCTVCFGPGPLVEFHVITARCLKGNFAVSAVARCNVQCHFIFLERWLQRERLNFHGLVFPAHTTQPWRSATVV